MNNVLKVLKINVLALIAFPFLLIATGAKLLSKAIEKSIELIKIAAISIGVICIFEFVRGFSESSDLVLLILLIMVMIGALIAVFMILLSIAAAVIAAVISLLIGAMEILYLACYSIFSLTYNVSKADYETLSQDTSSVTKGVCFLYHIVHYTNIVITFLAKNAFTIMLLASSGVVIGSGLFINSLSQRDYGINIFSFIKLFPTFEIIYGVVLFLTVTLGISSMLVTLGLEWSEWGEEMEHMLKLPTESDTTSDIPSDANVPQQEALLEWSEYGEAVEPILQLPTEAKTSSDILSDANISQPKVSLETQEDNVEEDKIAI